MWTKMWRREREEKKGVVRGMTWERIKCEKKQTLSTAGQTRGKYGNTFIIEFWKLKRTNKLQVIFRLKKRSLLIFRIFWTKNRLQNCSSNYLHTSHQGWHSDIQVTTVWAVSKHYWTYILNIFGQKEKRSDLFMLRIGRYKPFQARRWMLIKTRSYNK